MEILWLKKYYYLKKLPIIIQIKKKYTLNNPVPLLV